MRDAAQLAAKSFPVNTHVVVSDAGGGMFGTVIGITGDGRCHVRFDEGPLLFLWPEQLVSVGYYAPAEMARADSGSDDEPVHLPLVDEDLGSGADTDDLGSAADTEPAVAMHTMHDDCEFVDADERCTEPGRVFLSDASVHSEFSVLSAAHSPIT